MYFIAMLDLQTTELRQSQPNNMVQPTKEDPRVARRDSIKARLGAGLSRQSKQQILVMYVINATTVSFLRELIIYGSAW